MVAADDRLHLQKFCPVSTDDRFAASTFCCIDVQELLQKFWLVPSTDDRLASSTFKIFCKSFGLFLLLRQAAGQGHPAGHGEFSSPSDPSGPFVQKGAFSGRAASDSTVLGAFGGKTA